MKFRKFSCQICNKTFSSKCALNSHHKAEHDEFNPNKCKICLKGFVSKSKLAVHSRVHTSEKHYVCKQLADKSSL